MAVYVWECDKCKEKTEVIRSIAEYERGPDAGCEKCGSLDMRRIIAEWKPHQTSLVHGGKAPWFAESYWGPRGIPTGK